MMLANAIAIGAQRGHRSALSLLPSPVAHWNPGLGMATSEASGPNADLETGWTDTNVSRTGGQADHAGGTSASQFLETTTTGLHRTYSISAANAVDGPVILSVYAKILGGREVWLGTGADSWKSRFDTAGTATAIDAGTNPTTSGPFQNSFWLCNSYAIALGKQITLGVWSGATSYAGDVTKGAVFSLPRFVQHRCSTLSDQIGTADLSNSSSTTQIFVQKSGGASPGGNSWGSTIVAIWQPNDSAKTLLTDDADLMTALDGDFTIVADIWVYAAATAAVPLFATTADVPTVCGLGTDRKLYVTCGTSVAATAALAVGRHQIAFRRVAATNTWTIYADGALVAGPTALTPGGATTPSELTLTMRCTGLREAIVDSTAVNDTTTIAVLNALKVAA